MAARPQLYHVVGMYVTDRGNIIDTDAVSFHYLKDARKYAYEQCRKTGHREAYFTIRGPGGISSTSWGKRVGAYIKSDGKYYFEDNKMVKHPVRSGGRKKKTVPAPFGL